MIGFRLSLHTKIIGTEQQRCLLFLNYVWQSSKGNALINATVCVIKLDELLFDLKNIPFSVPLLFRLLQLLPW